MSVAPYSNINDTWPKYEPGWWVRAKDGRVGLVNKRLTRRRYIVQFGSGGPFEQHRHDDLMLATKHQVRVMEGLEA